VLGEPVRARVRVRTVARVPHRLVRSLRLQ
jgi:hypothetical protein